MQYKTMYTLPRVYLGGEGLEGPWLPQWPQRTVTTDGYIAQWPYTHRRKHPYRMLHGWFIL